MTTLIYQRDGVWYVEDRITRQAVAGSPARTRDEAERVASDYAGCLAAARASREHAIKQHGTDDIHFVDPS
jgi:hypothetical protein